MPVNMTIDDSSPSVTYYPAAAWNARSASIPCSSCTANPDTSKLFDNTFHDGTFNPVPGSNNFPNIPLTASLEFNGTAVYVFCALAESSTSPDGDSDMSFYIDGSLKGTFVKTAPGNNNVYDYAIPVFSIDSLPLGMHNVTLQNGHVNGTKALVLLDEIVYTTTVDDSPSVSSSQFPTSPLSSSADSVSSTRNLGVIIGATVAVPVVVLTIVALAIYFFLKRRKRRWHQEPEATSDSPDVITRVRTTELVSIPPQSGLASSSSQHHLNSGAGPSETYFSSRYALSQPSPSSNTPSVSGGTSRISLDADPFQSSTSESSRLIHRPPSPPPPYHTLIA